MSVVATPGLHRNWLFSMRDDGISDRVWAFRIKSWDKQNYRMLVLNEPGNECGVIGTGDYQSSIGWWGIKTSGNLYVHNLETLTVTEIIEAIGAYEVDIVVWNFSLFDVRDLWSDRPEDDSETLSANKICKLSESDLRLAELLALPVQHCFTRYVIPEDRYNYTKIEHDFRARLKVRVEEGWDLYYRGESWNLVVDGNCFNIPKAFLFGTPRFSSNMFGL